MTNSVLIAENEPVTAKYLKKLLTGFGYKVIGIVSGCSDILNTINKMQPGTILIDINLLQEEKSIETLTELKQGTSTPIIFLTDKNDRELLTKAETIEPYAYVMKHSIDENLDTAIKTANKYYNLEKILRKNESLYSSLLEEIPGAIYRCCFDDDFTMSYISNGITELTGYPPDYFINNRVMSFSSVMHPDDRNKVSSTIRKAISLNRPYSLQFRILDSGFHIHHVYERGRSLAGQNDESTILQGAILDITDYQMQLNKYQKAFQSNSHAMLIIKTESCQIIEANEEFTRLTGYSGKDLSEKTLDKTGLFISKDNKSEIISFLKELKTIRGMQVDILPKNEKAEHCSLDAEVIGEGNEKLSILTLNNISEQIKTLEAESLARHSLQTLIDASTDATFLMNTEGIILAANYTLAERFSLKKEDLIGQYIYDYFPEDVAANRKLKAQKVIQDKKGELFIDSREGIIFENSIYPVIDQSGKIYAIAGFARDVTEILKSEQKLKFQSSILDQLSTRILAFNSDEIITYCNISESSKLGMDRDKIIGQHMGDFSKCLLSEEIINHVKQNGEWKGILSQTDNTNKLKHYDTDILSIFNSQDKTIGYTAIFTDITEIKNTQDEIKRVNENLESIARQNTDDLIRTSTELQKSKMIIDDVQERLLLSEKMARLGDMVASSTHEINTPISLAILSASHAEKKINDLIEMVKSGSITEESLFDQLDKIKESAVIAQSNLHKSADLINSLKIIAVDQCSEEKRTFNISDYIREIILTLKPELKKINPKLHINVNQDITITGYPGIYSSIISNLIINSLIHGFTDIEDPEIHLSINKINDDIVMIYNDNGVGIEKELLPKIFDQYFTTRREKGGSGLGLHIVSRLVKENLKGNITAESKPGEGLSFKIIIPIQ